MDDVTQRPFWSGGAEAFRAAIHDKAKANDARCIEDRDQNLCVG